MRTFSTASSIPQKGARFLTGIAFTAALLLQSCSPSGQSGVSGPLVPGVKPGETDRKGSDEVLGKPVSVRPSELVPGSENVEYSDGASVQFRDGKVSLVRRVPRGDEAFVQYWLHKYSDANVLRRKVNGESGAGHGAVVEELAIPAVGRTIHFEADTGRVIHLFAYPPTQEGK